MTLLDSLRKKYVAKAKCTNCGAIQEVSIPRGITIEEFFKEKLGLCKECGCNSLIGHKAKIDSPIKITPRKGTWQ